jgi:hypothetical protein
MLFQSPQVGQESYKLLVASLEESIDIAPEDVKWKCHQHLREKGPTR